MKENLIHYRTCVCNINYHMVWSVKYRRKILSAEVEAYLQELVQEIAEDKGIAILGDIGTVLKDLRKAKEESAFV